MSGGCKNEWVRGLGGEGCGEGLADEWGERRGGGYGGVEGCAVRGPGHSGTRRDRLAAGVRMGPGEGYGVECGLGLGVP